MVMTLSPQPSQLTAEPGISNPVPVPETSGPKGLILFLLLQMITSFVSGASSLLQSLFKILMPYKVFQALFVLSWLCLLFGPAEISDWLSALGWDRVLALIPNISIGANP